MLSPRHDHSSDVPPGHPCHGCPVRDVAICGSLDADELKAFRKSGCCMALTSGQSLFCQGESVASVFTVTEGLLKSYRILADGRRQVTGFHMPGDFIGNMVGETHEVTAEAVNDCRVCAFPVRRFSDFVDDHPSIERELYVVAARELAEAREQMVLLGRMTAVERIASFFIALRERSNGDLVELAMSRSDIADYLGLTKETVSRVLSDLKGSRIIRLEAIDRVQILDVSRLKQIADGV